jgi:hypothetical protein
MPNVDYSDPKNFAFFGSAERYYDDGFKRIRNTYPYDGSEKEKYDWIFDSTFIDMYLFEHKYPRFNGHVSLSYPSWGTLNGSIIDGYGKSTTNTYIKTFGGPNKSDLIGLQKQYGDANILDNSKSRESNLKFNLNDGVTLEMWVKKPAFDTSKTEKEVLFDLWNGEASSSAQYGRLRLELTGASAGSPFLFTALSGTSGVQNQSIGQNLTTGSIVDWTHVALSLKNSGSDISANLYINGNFNQAQTLSSAAIDNVTGSLISYIGALRTAPSGSPTVTEGAGKFSGSLDEFRYWKTERNSKEVGRYYWTNIGGGTNTDEANTNLGVYYKFNEGITQTASIDSTVLDYSGRVSNGAWVGYQSGARSEESAIVLAGASAKEFKDPTIYSSHPQYISTLNALKASGSMHDINNNASLIKSVPGWILDEDKEEGNVNILTHIMASYYDNLYLHIQDLNSLKDVYAHFQTKINDKNGNTNTEGGVKPLPFADRLLTNAGFVAPELFADASVIEALATRSEDENYEMKIHDVKNQIYQNVYSSLINIYKEKGTNKAFRNVLHAFGIDEDVVKINFYGDNVDFEVKDRYNIRATKEKFVDFNHPDRFNGTVYQYASGSNGVSFISGSGAEFEKYIPITVETQVILPNKLEWNSAYGYNTPFTKSVILGMHQADASDGSDYTIPGTDYSEIQMYSERDRVESKRVRFHLSSSVLGVHLSSSLYDDMYLNNEWLFSFRIRNEKFPTTDFVASSSLNADYIIDFVGYNTEGNYTINSFELSSSVTEANAHNFLNSSKRIYAGAKRTNFTGSVQESSDHKIGFVRYWMNYLDNETLLHHSYDSSNIGAKSPMRSAYLMEDDVNDIKIPEIDTLLLNWDFKTLSNSDSNGQFISLDVTSGSGEQRYVQAFEDVKRKFYHGRGDFFLSNDEKVIDVEYINAARSTYPEILQGDDMIEIRQQDDIQFTKETLPQDFYIAFEKSMAQTVSEEMIRFMSSVKDFNNLIGRPVDKYREEYKDLRNLRQLFFERVSNEPDLDKYIDYYKWLDDSLGEMLVALVPASLAHSDGINNVIENYVFSRDKYTHKFPTIEFKTPTLEGGMNTINRHLYPWKQGHAPVGGTPENENCFWWLERAERDRSPLSGSTSGSNNSRVKVFQARNSVLNRSYTTAQHFAVDRARAIHGGTNYEDNKKRDYIWSATKEVAESPAKYGEFGAFPLRYVITNNDMFFSLKDCTDERPVTEKIKRAFSALDGFQGFHHELSGGHDGLFKGGMVMPFNIMSSSVSTGYTGDVSGTLGADGGSIDITNVHSDTTDLTNEIPMQSPFTERWVGGHQSRHAPLNKGSDSESNRGEGYKILLNNIENASGSIGVAGADYPYPYSNQAEAPHFRIDQAKARYYRDERAKRPLNIKNIQTSGSQVGNYQKTYQFVHTFGRSTNKTRFIDIAESNLHNTINSRLPETNLEASLVSRGVGGNGNLASNFNSSSLYLGGVKSTTENSVTGDSKHVIANRFSAPGGFETMSEVFLDMYGKEKSAYNALPFRNLQVRGLGSGEAGTIRLFDIHGNRYGLLTHLTRHSAQFGIDSVLGADNPAFHKVNRNPKWDASEQAKDNDNYWVQHQIPQSDYQYQWVKQSHSASAATSSMSGHILSGLSEPSGNTSRFPHEHNQNTVLSQSVINQRIDGVTSYGYPTWEQIRNNDTNANNRLKKSYGYNLNSESVEESRVTENIPNTANVQFKESEFTFKYPYVNMKYHFDSMKLRFDSDMQKNETLYDSLYGYYSKNTDDVEILKKNIKQIIFPRYVKHTKYSTRHRHYFVSKFWTDGENELYNTDTSETGSYHRLDEVGRRKTNVTASLFKEGSLNKQVQILKNDGYLTNVIPSQSIWNMDSRTNFTSSNAQSAASNSAGAPGVLQSQDHHFHNGLSEFQLLESGSVATGSFKLKGATRFGSLASGSFTVQGMQPTGIAASGAFEITGANVQGTAATGEFTVLETFTPPVSSSFRFTADERTVLGTSSTASFEVSGAHYVGTTATNTFTVSDTRQYTAATHPTATFRVSGSNIPEVRASASVTLKGIHESPTATTGTFTLDGAYNSGTGSSGGFTLESIKRYGDRAGVVTTFNSVDDNAATNRDAMGITIAGINFKTQNDDTSRTDDSTNKWIKTYKERKFADMGNSGYMRHTTFSGFTAGNGVAIFFHMDIDTGGAGEDPTVNDTYDIVKLTRSTFSDKSIEILYERTGSGISATHKLVCRRYFNDSTTDYRETKFTLSYSSGGFRSFKLTFNDSYNDSWNLWIDGSSITGVTTESGTVSSGDNVNACASYIYVGDPDSDFSLKIADLAIYDVDLSGEGVPTSAEHYNSGKWFDHANFTSSGNSTAEGLVSYYTFGNNALDTISNVNDVAPNSNNNALDSNITTAHISFDSFDNASDDTFNQTNLRTLSEFIEAWESKLSTALGSNFTVTYDNSRLQVRSTNTGYDFDVSLISQVVDGTYYSTFSQVEIAKSTFSETPTVNEIKSNDQVELQTGDIFEIRHVSPIDEGNVFTIGSSPSTNLYETSKSQAWRWASTSLQRVDLYNTNYSGFNDTSTDMTFCAWLRAESNTSGRKQIAVFFQQSSDTTPSTKSLDIYQNYDDIIVQLEQNGSSNNKAYTFSNVLSTERYQFVAIVIDRGSITTQPVLYIDGVEITATPTSTGSGTGVCEEINSIFIADYPNTSTNYEFIGAIAQISIWSDKLTSDDILEIYNYGRYRELITHPKFINCNDWWLFEGGTSSELPSLDTDLTTQVSNENTLSSLSEVPTGITSNNNTVNQNDLTLISAAGVTDVIKLTYGIIFEGKIYGGSVWTTNTASAGDFWDHMDTQIEADSNYESVTRVSTDSGARADFTIITPVGQEATNTPSFTQDGSSFSDAVQFSGYVAPSGILSSLEATKIYIRRRDSSGAYDKAGSLSDTNNYVQINFQFSIFASDATSPSHNHNPVNITVYGDTDTDTDAELWDKVLEAINNSVSLDVTATRTNGTFTLISNTTGDGNTYFIREDDEGNHISGISNTGGTEQIGVSDAQRFEIPYYDSSTRTFENLTFEIDIATGGTNALTNASHIALPALPSSEQTWQSTYTISEGNNSQFWNAITGTIAAADSGKVGDNYDIAYTVDSSGAEPEAKIVFTVKEDAFSSDGVITSGSWDNENITTAGESAPSHEDFSVYSAECGVKEGDFFRLTVDSATKQFEIDSGSFGDDGNTRRIDAYGVSSATFWSNLSTALTQEMGSGFTVSYTVNDDTNNCDDYSDFTITKNSAGLYNFDISKVGDSFSNETDTDGTNAFGFGTSTGGSNRLQIGGTTVVQAATDNTYPNVDRDQSQTNIINNIISSIEATSPGTNYTVTSAGTGNSRTFTVTANTVGTADNRTLTGNGQFTSNGNIIGGTNISGSVSGHSISIGTETYTLSTTTSSPSRTIDITDRTDEYVWSNLESQIEGTSSFNVSRTNVGNVATFTLTSKVTGSDQNNADEPITSADASFDITQTAQNGTSETGAIDGHYINFYADSGAANGYRVTIDKDNSNTGGLNYSASVAVSGFTTIYVDSTRASNTDFWNTIETALEAEGFAVAQGVDNPRTFTVTNYVTGAAGNGGASGNGGTSGGTFVKIDNAFATGSDSSGADLGDTIEIDGTTFTITHTSTSSASQVQASGVTDAEFWESLRTKVNVQTGYSAVTGSDSPRTFTITSVSTGSSEDPNISVTGDTFAIVDAGTAGTDETGAENGDTITIDGQTFSIDISSGLGTGSTANFHNALSHSIKTDTDFDTIAITNLGTGYHRFSLTSSVTGTAKNVAFSQNTNGSRATFQNLAGAAGGTSPIGIGDLDYIRFHTDYDDDALGEFIYFRADLNGDETDSTANKYIDVSGYTGTDAEKSTKFWNDLSQSIKDHTLFDTISISSSSNVATLSITSSVTGALFNNDLYSVYNGSDGIGFTITNNTSGGTDESGATSGDTITIDDTIFTIVHNSSPTSLQINASGVTDNNFFNALTAAVEANTDMSATFTVASNTGSFELTSSVTGTAKNISITETGNSFDELVGLSGGINGVFRGVKFGEVIPQPRYAYPHTLQSPGSMRNPTAKSNLGLIHEGYKLRSNHFALTRSLGHSTDGMFDNTSRWTTPDLSGLTPMDNNYNDWYERIRGKNKHFSLVPEYRISSHIEGIIQDGNDEKSYFAQNYWLEITGASLDDGITVAKNQRGNSSEFLREYSTSTNIRDVENFIEDNTGDLGLVPFTLTLTCDAIKSFLPYEGFYPQSRTVQMCEAFAGSYGKGISAQEANPSDTDIEFPDNNVLAQARPVFDAVMSPGLLYNTIKSGMAVDYPIVTSKMATASLKDPYGGTNHMISNELFDSRLPFETLLSPESFMSKEYIVDMNPHPSSSFNLKAKIGEASDSNYKLMSSNFFSEVMEFFLQEGKSSRIVSKPETDPDFGIVVANHAGMLPTYRSIFRVYKSRKEHPYIEFSGAADVINNSSDVSGAYDKYYNRPPSGTNYFLSEYQGLTGSALEYDVQKVNYPRPQINSYAEVETITMYSQPNAFGPPCAGGVAVEFVSVVGDTITTGENNNTTYMMYDSTNGYNAPFTPPYYDGEAWAIYTFTPQKAGKHTLNDILQNTTVDFLRYELNHESGSFGDRGTFGPQGFTINENAMQVDASFNLFKQANIDNQGNSWVIESKFETPILDFSKYLNREYNAEFESGVTSDDIYTSQLSLSGTRQEPDTLSSIHSSLSSVHQLSGVLNPIGMWHQYGEFPKEADKGIFMQMIDVPDGYEKSGTRLTIPNPKYTVVKPEISSCDGAGLDAAYNTNPRDTMYPYFARQELRRRLVGDDEFAVEGGSIQVINPDSGMIIDTELRYVDLQNIFGVTLDSTASVADNFKLFDVFRDTGSYTKEILTTNSDFTSASTVFAVKVDGTASSANNASSSSPFKGHWAASYYHYDQGNSYAPLLIVPKNYSSLEYDFGTFSKGQFEDALSDFSIGKVYTEQSTRFADADEVDCVKTSTGVVLAPSYLNDILQKNNNEITIGNLSKVNMTDASRASLGDLIGSRTISSVSTPSSLTQEAAKINRAINVSKANSNTFKSSKVRRKTFRLIPDSPAVSSLVSSDTSSYDFPEPMFVRGAIRYNAGAGTASSDTVQRSRDYFKTLVQHAPQSDKNITANPSTVRWGQFLHDDSQQQIKSLAKLVGFEQEPVKMGVTAKSRVIREAVVAVPYISNKDGIPEYLNLKLTDGTSQDPEVLRQMEKMKEYVFPPHLDFINYDVQPVPMYIFEFTKNLERTDLNGLWQGVVTEETKKVEEEQQSISHVLSPEGMLGSLKDVSPNMSILKKVRWRIFKVKQRGNFSYDEKMNSDIGKSNKINSTVGYNWPYDYFSLVENVKLSVDVELKKPQALQGAASIAPEGGYSGTGITNPVGFDASDLEIGTLVQTSQIEISENAGQSYLAAELAEQQESTFNYNDAKLAVLREFKKIIRADLNSRNKNWSDLNNRRKRRYVERAKENIVGLIVYQDMVDKFPNIEGYVSRLRPRDF